MIQPESVLIVHPFTLMLENQFGWHVEKTHGSQFQEGFPDLRIMHPTLGQKWVECKVVRNGTFSFTDAQLTKFPVWMAHGEKIWIVYGTDFRFSSPGGEAACRAAYNSLFMPPNCHLFWDPRSRRRMIG